MKPEWNQVAEAVFNSVGLPKSPPFVLFRPFGDSICNALMASPRRKLMPALATIAGAAATDNHDYEYGLWPFENIDAKPDSPGASP